MTHSHSIQSILAHHDVTNTRLVVSACLECGSITSAPDTMSKRAILRDYDMTCCSPETTHLFTHDAHGIDSRIMWEASQTVDRDYVYGEYDEDRF